MKQLLVILFSLFLAIVKAQNIYSRDYGNHKNPPIIFIHGGPSGNSTLFEATTAKNLANKGFYVIVYDRRGEGRSKDENATMTFKESFDDLLWIYNKYHIKKANILGHSFGGIIATLFADQYPERARSLILAGALFSQQETYDHILKQAKEHFKDNPSRLEEILQIENLNKNSAEYRKKSYDIASELDFFKMPALTAESQNLRKEYETGEFYKTNYKNQEFPIRFYNNEAQNNLDNKPVLKNIIRKGIPIFAIYGKNDGIFSDKQLNDLKNIVGNQNFEIIDNCSHYLFVDQQNEFIKFINAVLK